MVKLPAGDRQLVQIMDAALAEARRRAGPHLACRLGCTQCCHGPFPINALDVARLKAGMDALQKSDPALAQEVERRARAWVKEFAPAFPGDPETGVLGDSEAERAQFEELADDAPCPALDPVTGGCDVYPWRPMTCRVFGPPVRQETGALGCCELCFTTADDEEIATCEMPVPHDLEEELVAEMRDRRETVVAYALLEPR
ncbi:MAG TPA: YkgJ family cysteine cluster protein [Terracidiphilus sp.]|nr:YkgJ family cysteine cluster protein [Terracidiphilus sp.]